MICPLHQRLDGGGKRNCAHHVSMSCNVKSLTQIWNPRMINASRRMAIAIALMTFHIFPAVAGPITVIDGDTVERDGERWRLAGIDAPEIHRAHCPAERQLALKAAGRLIALLEARGGRIIDQGGKREKYGRRLGRLVIGWPTAGEEDWAEIAIREGLAVAWTGRGRPHDWCR